MSNSLLGEVHSSTRENLIADHHGTVQKRIVLAAGNGIIDRGTVLAKITATGEYAPYVFGEEDGTGDPVGLHVHGGQYSTAIDTTSAPGNSRMYVHGTFNRNACIGLDEYAISVLESRGLWFDVLDG